MIVAAPVSALTDTTEMLSKRIESRPSHHAKWEYGFFIDLAGHIDDEAMKQALAELKQHSAQIKVLGSYPVAVP